jgi:hypothetical protein
MPAHWPLGMREAHGIDSGLLVMFKLGVVVDAHEWGEPGSRSERLAGRRPMPPDCPHVCL